MVEEVTKPDVDVKHYRYVVLKNSIKALLISDPRIDITSGEDSTGMKASESSEAGAEDDEDEEMSTGSENESADGMQQVRKSAAALAVGVGSFADPRDMQGLSHYLEHMLFMGSEEFPGEADFDQFISARSGSTNAYTECELTNFHFDVGGAYLRPALQRFAAFFKTPVCSESALEREVCAVESEFVGVSQNDECRMAAVLSATALEKHPLSTFMWGNKKSLWTEPLEQGIPIRERILQHWRSFYSASCMNLVVMGGESLDVLEEYVTQDFGPVENKSISAINITKHGMPFEGSGAFMVPAIREGHHITFTFQLPSLLEEYGKKAEDYWGHVLGHEGPGSLLSALKARRWATGLSAGVGSGGQEQNSGYFLFSLEIELTLEGLNAAPGMGLATAEMLFAYISMLTKTGPQKWIWEEMKGLNDCNFRFREEGDCMDTVSDLAASLFCYRPEHALNGGYLFEEWDETLVARVGAALSAQSDGLRVDLQTSEFKKLRPSFKDTFEGSKECQEKWFEMSYLRGGIPSAVLQAWDAASPGPEMCLPPRNPFIASNFALLSDSSAHTIADLGDEEKTQDMEDLPEVAVLAPVLVLEEAGIRLFHRADTSFGTPRAVACFRLSSDSLWQSAVARASGMLLVDCLKDSINEVVYQADQALLSAQVSYEGPEGFQISLYGFNDKLQTLACSLAKALRSFEVGDMWPALKEQRCQKHKNAMLDVEKHVNRLRLRMLLQPSCSHAEVQEALEALTPEDVLQFHAALLKDCHLEALMEGNISQAEAVDTMRSIQQLLSGGLVGAANDRRCSGCVQLASRGQPVLSAKAINPDEMNSAVQVYLQLGSYGFRLRALQLLCQQILNEPLFNELRTEQQLGYSVHISPTVTTGTLGLVVSVTSERTPAFVERAVCAFLDKMQATVEEMPAQDFAEHVQSVATTLLEAPHNIDEQVEYHWSTIWEMQYLFYDKYQVHAELQKLTLPEVAAFYVGKIAASGNDRRALTVCSASQQHSEGFSAADGYVLIEDVGAEKDKLQVLTPSCNSIAMPT